MEKAQSTQQLPQQQQAQQEQPQLSQKEQADLERYTAGLSRILHGKETRDKIYGMLQSMPPEKSIPQAALAVNERVEQSASKNSKKPTPTTLIGAAVFLTGELVEIGNAGKFFEQPIESPEQMQPILMATIQGYIEKGLKDGSIDPVELQTLVEPLLNEEQKQMGLAAGQQAGIPQAPGVNTAMESYASQRVSNERKKMQAKSQAQQAPPTGGAMQQVARGGA